MMRAGAIRFSALTAVATVLAWALGCGKPSEEARIRGLLHEATVLAEKGDIAALEVLFDPDYLDFEGRDVTGTVQLVEDYLGQFRKVVIHLLGLRVGDNDPDGRASIECEVSLSHGAAEIVRRLIRYTGEYYRFRIELKKEIRGNWRFTYAEWRSIGLPELFPESLDILRKLFPDL